MIRNMYEVVTRIRTEPRVKVNTDLIELRSWCKENLGEQMVDWSTSLNHARYICVAVSTREQATFTALRWA